MIWILGEKGRLANAIYEEYSHENPLKIFRNQYLNWLDFGTKSLEEFLEKNLPPKSIIFVAAGVVDRKISPETIHEVNVLLPVKILEATKNLDISIVTIGSISEYFNLVEDPYIESKKALSKYIENETNLQRNLHIRLHTLYGGGTPHKDMFLGKILKSIENQIEFNMSSGEQLREYHHVADVSAAISAKIQRNQFGQWNLNTGKPVKLIELAKAIFESYKLDELIKISLDYNLAGDNLGFVFPDTIKELDICFREPVAGVISYLRSMTTDIAG